MSSDAEKGRRLRPITKDGKPLRVHLYRELWRELDDFIEEAKDELRVKASVEGEPMFPGETLGKTWALGAIVAWFARLSDEDRKRVQVEGKALLLACGEQPIGYKGELPFARNTGSVFGAAGSVVEAAEEPVAPRKRHTARGVSARRHAGEDGGERQDAAPVAMDRPRRRP
jgi:hypothetical protein